MVITNGFTYLAVLMFIARQVFWLFRNMQNGKYLM